MIAVSTTSNYLCCVLFTLSVIILKMSDDNHGVVLTRIVRKLREVELLMSDMQHERAKSVLEECCRNLSRIRTRVDTAVFDSINNSCEQLMLLCNQPSATPSSSDEGYRAPRISSGLHSPFV